MSTNEDLVQEAQRTQADLVKRLTTARKDLDANEERRAAIAFEAETGDAAARRSIAELTKAAAALDVDIKTVEAAVVEAARRVRAATEDLGRQAERDKARKVRAVSARLAGRGTALEAGLNQFREAYRAFQDDLRELAALGAPAPSAALVDVNSRRALDAALDGLHSKMRPVPPLERHGFAELCAGWARPSAQWAAAILDAPADKAA